MRMLSPPQSRYITAEEHAQLEARMDVLEEKVDRILENRSINIQPNTNSKETVGVKFDPKMAKFAVTKMVQLFNKEERLKGGCINGWGKRLVLVPC